MFLLWLRKSLFSPISMHNKRSYFNSIRKAFRYNYFKGGQMEPIYTPLGLSIIGSVKVSIMAVGILVS